MVHDERQELSGELAGLTVWVTADRRAEDQAVMFRRLGADVLLAPTMGTVFGQDDLQLRQRTEDLIARPPDYFIANTGIGVRTWIAKAAEWGLADDLTGALRNVRILARGPKASGALDQRGASGDWRAPGETLAEVIDHALHGGVAGSRVALQLHGDEGEQFVGRLRDAGAEVVTVAPYRWVVPDRGGAALQAIERCCRGEVDAITFTAGPQVRMLLAMADEMGRAGDLLGALNGGTIVGCVGPVCAAVAEDEGISGVVVPDHWRLGSLVKAVASALSARATIG